MDDTFTSYFVAACVPSQSKHTCTSRDVRTVVSRYYDTAGRRKKYHNIQTIELSSINFLRFAVVGILIWYHNKQHFKLSDIVITRDYCMSLQVCTTCSNS